MIDLDIFYALFLIVAFIALKKKKIILFSIFYCISILTKWQPIVIVPFFIIYISELNIKNFSIESIIDSLKSLNFQNLLKSFLVVIIFVSVCSITYGFLPIAKSFYVSLNHNYLSGNALNFNWIITWLLQLAENKSYNGQIQLHFEDWGKSGSLKKYFIF